MAYFKEECSEFTKMAKTLNRIMDVLGIKHPGYIEKVVESLKDEADELKATQDWIVEVVGTDNIGNAKKSIRSKFSNEPAPPTEAELVYEAEQKQIEEVRIRRAQTIYVYDSIVEAIGTWSKDGQIAPDVELAINSSLFPTVYERMMKGDNRYFIEEIPEQAPELVRQARELIRDTRAELDVAVTDPKHWNDLAPRFQSWVVQTMLPALYNDTDPAWITDEPLSLEQMQSWKDKPASRPLESPLIFDAYENVDYVRKEYGRIEIGIAEFHRSTLETRIDTELPVSC